MYVRLPDDYQFGTISPEPTTSSPMLLATYTADDQHGDSPVAETETMLQSAVTHDVDTPVAVSAEVTRRVARRSSTSLHQSSATHFHLPLFQRRRTTRRRVAVNTSFITAATVDTDNGMLNAHTVSHVHLRYHSVSQCFDMLSGSWLVESSL